MRLYPRSSFLLHILATRCGFFLTGLGLAVWAPLVPYVHARIPMSEATFGLLLLSIGLGSLCCMPLSALFTGKFGIRRTALSAILLLASALFGIIFVEQLWLMAVTLFVFGGSLGVLDIVFNIQGMIIEARSGRSMMAGFHGMYSLGTICGAMLVTLLLMAGTSPVLSPLLAVTCILLLGLWSWPGLLSRKTRSDVNGRHWPNPTIILVGLMCFIVYLAEGAILDWSALFLVDYRGLQPSSGGLGYTAFALMITLGRFLGDGLVARLGRVRMIFLGGLIAAGGLSLSLMTSHWLFALLGYGLCGLGCANISPLLISSLNHQTHMPPHLAVTAATTIGFAGVLAGPALMGMIAQHSSLAHAFGMVALGLLLVAIASPGFRTP